LARERSPVLLLARLLRMRSKGKLSPWLHGVLRLVAARLAEVDKDAATSTASNQWQDLRRSMPLKILPQQDRRQERQNAKDQVGSIIVKRARRFHNELTLWRNCESSQQTERVSQLREHMAELSTEMDTIKLRAFLCRVVAALSSPRSSSQDVSGEPLDAIAEERLKESASLQKSLREMLVWGLSTWRNTLNLEDEQIHHLLSHVRETVAHFEEQHGDIRLNSCARAQWGKIKSCVMTPEDKAAESKLKKNQSADPAAVNQSAPGERRHRQLDSKNIGIFSLMRDAMEKLGGQATSSELRTEVPKLPGYENLTKDKAVSKKKGSDMPSNLFNWQATVNSSMWKLFDPVLGATGVHQKRGSQKLWKTRKSARGSMPVGSSGHAPDPAVADQSAPCNRQKRQLDSKNAGIFSLMRNAMEKLGGQATSAELRTEVPKLPGYEHLTKDKAVSKTKGSDKPSNILNWEHSVNTNMRALFDAVLDETGVQQKRGSHKLWKTRESARESMPWPAGE